MERNENHLTGESADLILRNDLPRQWLLNEQKKDYGKDFLLEVADASNSLTGLSAFVQLKGAGDSGLKIRQSHISFSLEKKHAEYYFEKVRDLPVFLVVVDTQRRCTRYVFVQEQLEKNQKWRTQQSVTLRVPLGNEVKNHSAFLGEIVRANQWIRRKHPESIPDAIAATKERVQRKDPRFNVQVRLTEEKPHIFLQAKEPISIRLVCKQASPATASKIVDLIERGLQVEFEPNELTFEGSALIAELGMKGGAFQISRNMFATCSVTSKASSGDTLASLSEIPGEFVGGQSEYTFTGAWPKSPLSIELGPVGRAERVRMQFRFGMDCWNGQRICHLSYFDQIVDFVAKMPLAADVEAGFSSYGNELLRLSNMRQGAVFPVGFVDDLLLLKRARAVLQRVGVNPIWNSAALEDDDFLRTVNDLYRLLLDGGKSISNPSLKVTLECGRSVVLDEAIARSDEPRDFRVNGHLGFSLMGEMIEIGPLVWDFSQCRIQIDESASCTADLVQVQLLGTQKTVTQLSSSVPLDQLSIQIVERK